MESAEAKTGEPPVADVEKQQPLLLPPRAAAAAETKAPPSGDACDCDRETFPRASPTAARTLAFVVLVAGAAFASQLAAREEYVLLAVFASQLGSFCLFTSLLALCALPEDRGRRARWAAGAAGQVLQWSVAMAVPTSMACWVVQTAPAAVGAALLGLALAAVLACHAELVRALWPVQGPR
ncbi:hypothetical protein BDA96_06G132900 [Sorghum bicolor]|jgi:hypothetical protein|uniref:Uncharacterized protein n=2 Tax=Sorghum bicolor TaxID=4558 RepID=A0A921UD83_SORBI|nr:hypothetical protein SORBI_3006G120100 [Sorghum bicolor]KAG0526286.1 hypothetical protein BDA96_06G132900 [Sorghum bicolor]